MFKVSYWWAYGVKCKKNVAIASSGHLSEQPYNFHEARGWFETQNSLLDSPDSENKIAK